MGKIILTGFGPFGIVKVNPSEDIVKYFKGRKFDGDDIVTEVLDSEFIYAADRLLGMIDSENPHLVISMGVSRADAGTRREDLNLEKVAYNRMRGRNPDQRGYLPELKTDDEKENGVIIEAGAPEVIDMPWNAPGLVEILTRNGVRARTSENPSRYVCNDMIYRTAREIQGRELDTSFGFVHMPYLDTPEYRAVVESEGKATMPLEEVAKGVELIMAHQR